MGLICLFDYRGHFVVGSIIILDNLFTIYFIFLSRSRGWKPRANEDYKPFLKNSIRDEIRTDLIILSSLEIIVLLYHAIHQKSKTPFAYLLEKKAIEKVKTEGRRTINYF